MIKVEVASLVVDSRGMPVVILKPSSDDPMHPRLLPIWIGVQEATAIMLAIEGESAPRPMSYDLMMRLLQTTDTAVHQVAVTKLEEGTFYAEITLDTPSGRRIVDARPSDSIALAMRAGAPIFVARDVLAEAGVTEEDASEPDEESQVAEFTEFLDQVDPEDFRG